MTSPGAHFILILFLVDGFAEPQLPRQQTCVKCWAFLITSSCAPVTALTFLITGVNLFQQGFDTGIVDFPRKSAIDSWLLSGYSICAVEC